MLRTHNNTRPRLQDAWLLKFAHHLWVVENGVYSFFCTRSRLMLVAVSAGLVVVSAVLGFMPLFVSDTRAFQDAKSICFERRVRAEEASALKDGTNSRILPAHQ
jgi:hypothetical protein